MQTSLLRVPSSNTANGLPSASHQLTFFTEDRQKSTTITKVIIKIHYYTKVIATALMVLKIVLLRNML